MDAATGVLTQGAAHVLTNDNIAIVVLFLFCCGSAAFNFIMYRDNRKTQSETTKAMVDGAVAMTQVKILLDHIHEKVKS